MFSNSRSLLVCFCCAGLATLLMAGCQRAREVAPPPVPAEPVGYPLTVKDALGVEMTFPQPPQHIVSLAPSLTETAFALGLGDRLVGVTNYCKYPPEALQKEKVGGYVDASEEKIVSLGPDVIFATRGTPRPFMESLRGTGLKVYALDQTSWQQVLDGMLALGQICAVTPRAEEIVGNLRATRASIEARVKAAGVKPLRALMIISLEPLFVAGKGTFQSEMLEATGATNIATVNDAFGSMSTEAIIEVDPQALLMTNDENGRPMTRETQLVRLRKHPAWKNVTAVKTGKIVVVDVNHLSIPGPRLGEGLKQIARGLHPELFSDE